MAFIPWHHMEISAKWDIAAHNGLFPSSPEGNKKESHSQTVGRKSCGDVKEAWTAISCLARRGIQFHCLQALEKASKKHQPKIPFLIFL